MNDKSYIEKVLSHIGNKERKQQIEYELTDHIAEKEKWYEELEYDHETSAARAEEDMGDPDTAGEELAAIHSGTDKKSRIISVLLLILPLLGFAVAFLFTASSEPPSEAFELFHMLCFPLLCFMLAEMIYAFRKQRIIPLVLSSAVSVLVLHSEKFFALVLTTGRDIGRYVLSDYNDYMEPDSFYLYSLLANNGLTWSLLNTVRLILLFITAICAVVSLIIVIKNKNLKNRRYDYYIGRGIRAFLAVFAAVIFVSFTVQSYRLIKFEEEYTQSVAETISKQNIKAVAAVNNYMENGSCDFCDITCEFDLKDNPYCCTHAGDDVPVIMTYAAGFRNLISEIPYAPFEKEAADSMIEFVRSGGKFIEDAPMCCELTFDGEYRIILSCYTDYYGMNRLAFDYVDGRFQLADTQLCTEPDIKLSDEQLKQFYDAYRATRTDISEHLSAIKDPRYEFHVFSKIFSVAYNDIDGVYTAYFDYRPLGFTEIDGKLYVEDEYLHSAEEGSAKFRFSDGKAEILDYESGISTDYYGLLNDISLKGYKEFVRGGAYTELDGQRLKLSERTNSMEKFAKRYFISAPLTGLITYNADRTYTIDDFGTDEYGEIVKDNYKRIR